MKKIMLIAALLVVGFMNAQVIGADLVNFTVKTTAEMNAITVGQGLQEGSTCYNSTTKKIHYYDGSTWNEVGSGSGSGDLSQTDIDTFSELNTIVADETLAKQSDIGVTIQAYNANTDIDSTDDFSGDYNDLTNKPANIDENSTDDATQSGNNNFSGINTFTQSLSLTNGFTHQSIANLINGDVNLPGDLTTPNNRTVIVGGTDPTGEANLIFAPGGVERVLKATLTDLTYNGISLTTGGGGADNSLSEVDQTIAASTTRTINTAASSSELSFNQEGTELMRLGGNNDNAIYIRSMEVLPGTGTAEIVSVSDITVPAEAYGGGWDGSNEIPTKNGVYDEMELKISSDATGYGAGVTTTGNIVVWDYDVNPVEPTPIGGDIILGTDVPNIKVTATATWDTNNGAISLSGWDGVDDRTIDEGTFTLSNAKPGYKFTVWINRASAPTLSGAGLTFNALPNTTAFAAATEMAIYFEVGLDGTTVDYYYYER
jgi:hypothetical protein